jgi:hypothetical protein
LESQTTTVGEVRRADSQNNCESEVEEKELSKASNSCRTETRATEKAREGRVKEIERSPSRK